MTSNTSPKQNRKINSPLDISYYRGNIVLQHSYHHKVFRYPVFKIGEDYVNKKTKSLKYAPDLYDCDYEVGRIEKLANSVNKAIIELSKLKSPVDTIKKEEVDAYIAQNITEKKITSSQYGLIADFEQWIEEYKDKKYRELIKKGRKGVRNHPSAKDYVSTKNLLLDYEWDSPDFDNYDMEDAGKYVKRLHYNDIDEDFLVSLIEYCYMPRTDTKTHKYKTEGDLVNKSIQKRMDCLFAFLIQKYGTLPNGITKPHLDTIAKTIIRLDREELRQLEMLQIKDERFIRIRDYFLFLCYTGLRYGDFVRLDETFYDETMNELVLNTQKTSVDCRIYLFDKAKEIGEKYGYTFRGHTNQSLNRGIKDLLKAYNLYAEPCKVKYLQQEEKTIEKPKNEFISCHTGRKTFISMLIEKGLDVYDLMGMTGHKQRETLKYYVDLFGGERREKYQRINELLK